MAEEEAISPTSAKVKFLCSHGGKILPRPSDGHLKYVGGETRVLCIARTITFSDLMDKISNMFEGDFILKYQIGSEELDALVSVKSDEDLHHMLDEYDRVERGGLSKLRTFLFPAKPTLSEIHSPVYPIPESIEQRFVDAVNGIIRPTNTIPNIRPLHTTSSRLKSMSATQSECTSPRSPSPHAHNHNSFMNFDHPSFTNTNYNSGLTRMTKVHSSPSLQTLANHNPQLSNGHSVHHPRPYYPNYQTHQQHQHQYHSGHHAAQPYPSRDGFGRVPSMSNLAPVSHQSSAHSAQYSSKGYPGNGRHNRWSHHSNVGKPPSAYGDGSSRSSNVSPPRRGIIWD